MYPEIVGEVDCLAHPNGLWLNSVVNFDNVGMGLLALFQVATFEGWLDITSAAADQRGIGKQPAFEHSFQSYVFFIIFIIFGSLLSLNLFVGVIIDSFNRLKSKFEAEGKEGGLFMTDSQRM